jgi:hypothetical protein
MGQISENENREETQARRSPSRKDADNLLAFGEGITTILAESRALSTEAEALLRASIAAAAFAFDTYLAVLAGAKKSRLALSQLAQARSRCDRKIEQLRRRVSRSIEKLCRYMGDRDLTRTAEYVLSLSS